MMASFYKGAYEYARENYETIPDNDWLFVACEKCIDSEPESFFREYFKKYDLTQDDITKIRNLADFKKIFTHVENGWEVPSDEPGSRDKLYEVAKFTFTHIKLLNCK